jgi:hypothetical protein
MLRFKLRFYVHSLLILLVLIPLSVQAKSNTKRQTIDLSILEQIDTLAPHMTAQQGIDYIKLEEELTAAESDLRSGRYLAATKRSTMSPNRNIAPTIERGKKLIASSEKKIYELQVQLVELLNTVEKQRIQNAINDQKKFNYSLSSTGLDAAILKHSQQLLEKCWALGYETLFFDGVFISSESATERADAALRNQVYDALVKIDGQTFSVSIPVNFKLKSDTTGTSASIFTYENETIFTEDQKALLVIEWITLKDSQTSLLSFRAVDLATQLIVAEELAKIKLQDEESGSATSAEAQAKDLIPQKVELGEHSGILDTLANLEPAYIFDLSENPETRVAAVLLTHSILANSKMQLTDSNFILRAYGSALDLPDAWVGQANAHLTLTKDSNESYQLNAQADGSDRILPCGPLMLTY